jgi:hypothetical protein
MTKIEIMSKWGELLKPRTTDLKQDVERRTAEFLNAVAWELRNGYCLVKDGPVDCIMERTTPFRYFRVISAVHTAQAAPQWLATNTYGHENAVLDARPPATSALPDSPVALDSAKLLFVLKDMDRRMQTSELALLDIYKLLLAKTAGREYTVRRFGWEFILRRRPVDGN